MAQGGLFDCVPLGTYLEMVRGDVIYTRDYIPRKLHPKFARIADKINAITYIGTCKHCGYAYDLVEGCECQQFAPPTPLAADDLIWCEAI